MADQGATLNESEGRPEGDNMNSAAECRPLGGGRRVRMVRLQWRRAKRAFDEVIVRAGDLAEDLLQRARDLSRSTAPDPDPNATRPTSEEWAAWANENLPAQDAEVFHRHATDDAQIERV